MDAWTALGRALGASPLSSDDCSRLEFDIAGRPAVLEEIWVAFNDDNNRAKTSRLRVDLRGVSPGTLKIYPEGVFFPIARLFGAQDLRIGDRLFDALYVIKATPASLAADVFGGPRRARLIETVRALGRYMSPVVDLTRDGLQIRTSEFEASRSLLERIVAAGTELTAALLEARPSSVLIWDEPSAAGPGRCPVCGSPLHGEVTHCRKCRTPHHPECWRYAGGCSTYACGQR
ncbi:MAG TPA: RING finger protein [Acidimicrobiales bacterium]|nr:RING finger protein [Acidimicrobiales bacterium]